MFFNWLQSHEKRRKILLKKVPNGALKDFLSVPFPDKNTLVNELAILSVDFETTGLNAINDKLLSVGFVEIINQQIKLSTCYHQIINTEKALDASNIFIHQITDEQKSYGKSLKIVVERLLQALAGKVMLVHFARIEKQFLKQACLELYGFYPPLLIIDTLALAKRKLDQRDIAYDSSELTLPALRKKTGLPNHFAHNALNDAIATAELFIAQDKHNNLTLKTLC
ncbi:MAG: DNA polymerase-3 subunit epsilon [Alteromonadaceae bacterium]|jgi:DNA polymerase-3 subunit epsilon|tara:strand:+ start:3805 stop:4479 length:675 start_codon:yes stop_codon:yes gene_type:complete